MSQPENPPAFPQVETDPALDRESGQHYSHVYSYGGMSLRDWFAGQALAGVLRYPAIERTIEIACAEGGDEAVNAQLARISYNLADAMIAAREAK